MSFLFCITCNFLFFQTGQLDQAQDEQANAPKNTQDEEKEDTLSDEISQIPETQETIPTTNSQCDPQLSIQMPSSDSEEYDTITDDEINTTNVNPNTTMSKPMFTDDFDIYAYTADE